MPILSIPMFNDFLENHVQLEAEHCLVHGYIEHIYSQLTYSEAIFFPRDLITCCKLDEYNKLRLFYLPFRAGTSL